MEIVDYPNYLIYPDGKVSSKRFPERYLRPIIRNKYLHYNLCNNGKSKSFRVHRLVALHYIPNPDNKPYVDHINRDKNDNRVENLRWVTAFENSQNQGDYKSNTSGYKNIYYVKSDNLYRYQKVTDGKVFIQYFKTLEEAVKYKEGLEF